MNILNTLFGSKQQAPAPVYSPPQDYYLPAIAIGAVFTFSINAHVPNMRQYAPLNFVEVYNPSTTALTCRIESPGGEMFRIEAASSRVIRVYFNNLIFTNIGANALAANTAILTLQRT